MDSSFSDSQLVNSKRKKQVWTREEDMLLLKLIK
jgi:hypothetical protein